MGAVTSDVAISAAENILKVLGRKDVPVFKGAQTPADLGKETAASRFIVDMVRKYPGRVEIIATGPLTNIATAMMMEPELPKLWHTLHFATGEFFGSLGEKSDWYKFYLLGLSDLNINVDVAATEYVLAHGGSFPVYPNELMDDISFVRSDYQKIKDAGETKSKLARFLTHELGPLNFLARFFRIPLHAVIPMGIILDPEAKCEVIEKAVVMKKSGIRGYAFALSDDPGLPKHKICFQLDNAGKNAIHEKLMQRLLE